MRAGSFSGTSFKSPRVSNAVVLQVKQEACLNRDLFLELGQKKKINNLWKKGLVLKQEYRAAVHNCRKKTQKAKVQLQLGHSGQMVSDNNNNKKGFLSMPAAKGGLYVSAGVIFPIYLSLNIAVMIYTIEKVC